MDIIPRELTVEILSIFGVLGSAWIVSNILSSNERSLFDRIFKRYNKIDNIYQLLPILQKNSKRLFLFFSDLTTSLKSVLSSNDTGITKEMVEGILSHEYYKNKIIEVQNEVFKEFNVDYKEVEEAIKRFSQDDQVEFHVSGVMRMYESVLNCTYPQCPGVEPNREITQAKYFEILEKVTITETKKWIQKQPGNIGNWGQVGTERTVEGGKTTNRFTSDANTRVNTANSVADKSSTESASSNIRAETISNSGKHSVTSEGSNTGYVMARNTSGRGRSNNRANLLRKSRLGGSSSAVSGSTSGNGVNVDDEMKNNKELQNVIMKELSKYGYDNYLDALVALKTSENYFYYFPNFNSSKMAITAKVKRVYSSNDVQKVSRHELELILETSEEDSLVVVLIFDDLIDETSFNKLVTVSTSERPIEELNRQFGLKYQTVPNGTSNGVGTFTSVGEGTVVTDGKDDSKGDRSPMVMGDGKQDKEVSVMDGGKGDKSPMVMGDGGKDNGNIGDTDGGRNTGSNVLNSLMNAATSREAAVTKENEGEVEGKRNNMNKVVTVWLFKEEFITSMKMQTYPALVIFNSGSMEEIRSI